MHCRTDSPVLRSSSASVPSILFSAMLNGFVSLWLTQMLKCRSSRSEANFRPQLPQAERGASLAGLSSNSLLLPLGISSLVVWPYSKGSLPMGTLRETFHPSGIRHCLREIVLGGHVHVYDVCKKIVFFDPLLVEVWLSQIHYFASETSSVPRPMYPVDGILCIYTLFLSRTESVSFAVVLMLAAVSELLGGVASLPRSIDFWASMSDWTFLLALVPTICAMLQSGGLVPRLAFYSVCCKLDFFPSCLNC